MSEINTRIKLKRDTETNWEAASDKTILNGEVILVDGLDGRLRAKIGDGTSTYGELDFIERIYVITEENKDEEIPVNTMLVIDMTEDDMVSGGISSTVTVTIITGGHTVTITDVNGIPHSFNVMDGKKGDKGDPFTYDDFTDEQLEALKGADGQDYVLTDADKAEIVAEVLAQIPNGNGVAY